MTKLISEQPERLGVIDSVHRASKAAQGAAPKDQIEENQLNRALRTGDEKLIRRWATINGCLLS